MSAADLGKFVVLDIESGAYEIDSDEMAVSDRLPAPLIEVLRLPWRKRGRALLADGKEIVFDTYEAEVDWDGSRRCVEIAVADTDPLSGCASSPDTNSVSMSTRTALC